MFTALELIPSCSIASSFVLSDLPFRVPAKQDEVYNSRGIVQVSLTAPSADRVEVRQREPK